MTNWEPKKGEMVIPYDHPRLTRQKPVEYVGIMYIDGKMQHICWDLDGGVLTHWNHIKQVDKRKIGELYRVKNEYDMQDWVIRRYVGDGEFAVPNSSETDETENVYGWDEWEEATDEEKRNYLNPWRKQEGNEWPNCKPTDVIERKTGKSGIIIKGRSDGFLWSGDDGIEYWRYAK